MAAANRDGRTVAGPQGKHRCQRRIQCVVGPQLHPRGHDILGLQYGDPFTDARHGGLLGQDAAGQ